MKSKILSLLLLLLLSSCYTPESFHQPYQIPTYNYYYPYQQYNYNSYYSYRVIGQTGDFQITFSSPYNTTTIYSNRYITSDWNQGFGAISNSPYHQVYITASNTNHSNGEIVVQLYKNNQLVAQNQSNGLSVSVTIQGTY